MKEIIRKNVYTISVTSDTISNKTDNQVLHASATNPDMFGIIITRYSDKLRRYIHRRTSTSNADADDILQNIFIKVYRNMHEFDESFAFSSWIYRIAHNAIIDWFRKQKIRPELYIDTSDMFWDHIPADERTDTELFRAELATELATAINSLPQKYQDIIILRFYEQKSYDEIADILQIPPGTVATHINRAKKQLKQLIHYEQ